MVQLRKTSTNKTPPSETQVNRMPVHEDASEGNIEMLVVHFIR
jgi:hypothetical protein